MSDRIGMGLANFPFSDVDTMWRWIDLCEENDVDSIWQFVVVGEERRGGERGSQEQDGAG